MPIGRLHSFTEILSTRRFLSEAAVYGIRSGLGPRSVYSQSAVLRNDGIGTVLLLSSITGA